jgi:predicted TIM-barrel fold metal-dependent hydrolase
MPGKGVQAVEIKSKIFDAHLHIIDPRFPLIPNQGYLPDHFTCRERRRGQVFL